MINVKLPPEVTEKITAAFFEETPNSYLGAGISATVYRGTVRFVGGHEEPNGFVFKVPHSHDHNSKIQDEFNILNRIAQQSRRVHPQHKVFTPEPILGNHPVDDHLILIMPFYENRLQDAVRDLLRKGQFVEAEKLAVQAMIDFSYTMQALHLPYKDEDGNEVVGGTSPDRKLKDFYLSPTKELTVIDWNVQRPYTVDNLSAEMGIIGQLYHELFLGSKGRSPYVPMDDNEWQIAGGEKQVGGVVSIGLRYLLEQMVDPRYQYKANNLPNAERLRQGLETWQSLLQNSALSLASVPPFDTITQVEHKAILADLHWREARAPLAGYLIDQRRDALQNVLNQRSQIVDTVANVIKQDTNEARKIIENYDVIKGNYQEWGHLRRWLHFTDLAISRDRNIRQLSQELHNVWNTLTRSFAADANPNLPDTKKLSTHYQMISTLLQNDLPDREKQALKIVQAEIKLRQLVVDYKAQREQLLLEQRLDKLNDIQDLIRLPQYVLPAEAPQKSDTLLGSVLDIEQERKEIEDEKQAKDNVENKIIDLLGDLETHNFVKAKQRLTEYLNNYGSKTYPDLKQRDPYYQRLILFGEQATKVLGLADDELPKFAAPLVKESEAILSHIPHSNESPATQQRLQKWVRKLQGSILLRVAQALKEQLAAPTWNDYKQSGVYYQIIKPVSTNSTLLTLPETAQAATITEAASRYESVGRFYKEWFPYFRESPEFDPQKAFEANLQWFFEERIGKVSEFMNEAIKLNISIDEMIDALKRGFYEHEGQEISLEAVLTQGFQAVLEGKAMREAEIFVGQIRGRYDEDRKVFEEQKQQYRNKLDEIENYLSRLRERDTQRDIALKKALEEFDQQFTKLTNTGTANGNLLERVTDLERWGRQVDVFFGHIKSIQNLGVRFRQKDIAGITRTLDDLDTYCANSPNGIGVALIEQQIIYWYNLLKNYKHLEYILTHSDNDLGAVQVTTKNKDKLFNLYVSHLRQLEDLMHNSDDLVFTIWQKEWAGRVEKIGDYLADHHKNRAVVIKAHIQQLISQSRDIVQRQTKKGN